MTRPSTRKEVLDAIVLATVILDCKQYARRADNVAYADAFKRLAVKLRVREEREAQKRAKSQPGRRGGKR